MAHLIDKDKVVAEIKRLDEFYHLSKDAGDQAFVESILSFINTLEVINPYELCIQHDSIETAIQVHAETYSFNIESLLFNQLTKEQQELWRKEIEEACISGGYAGVELGKDIRYDK